MKYIKNYYFSLRVLQADDMINIYNISNESSIPVETIYKNKFFQDYKTL